MNAPRIIVRYFGSAHWHDHARVVEASARRHCPGWVLDVQGASPQDLASPLGSKMAVVNTQKLDLWAEAVDAASAGDRLLLLDADTAVLRSIEDVWAQPFDLAYTTKPRGSRFPFNGGVVFVRVSSLTRAFLRQWQAANRFLFEHPKEHDIWKPHYGGMNQSALGMLLSSNTQAKPEAWKTWRHQLQVLRLPCAEWNCEDESWASFDPERTRIVHFKGELQRAILDRRAPTSELKPLLLLWREWLALAQDQLTEKTSPALPLVEHGDPGPSDVEHGDPQPTPVHLPPMTRLQRRRAAQTTPPMEASR